MKRGFVLFSALVFGLEIGSYSWAAKPGQFPQNATFTTKALTPFAIEGLTMDATGNFYTTGRQPDTTKNCPVWRIKPTDGSRVTVGFIQNSPACNPSGITFDSIGNLYIADAASGGNVWQVSPDAVGCASDDSSNPACNAIPNGTAYATGVPGTNGLAFDRRGNLWTGDGTTGQGRVWKITGSGADCGSAPPVNCEEVFRVQPMANEVNLVAGVGGVGRDVRSLPPGTITVTPTSRNAANTAGSQPLVANGVAFNHEGDLFVADTARGAIWRAQFDEDGTLKSPTGCDTTFTSNTLCLSNIFIAHPIFEGADGIALDVAGNIWVDANERNAVGVVTKDGAVVEIFRTPVNSAGLRNSADPSVGDDHILEFPTSPFLLGKKLCTSNADGNRRDNSPNTAGEITPAGPNRGKISCMDQDLKIPGMPLPVQ